LSIQGSGYPLRIVWEFWNGVRFILDGGFIVKETLNKVWIFFQKFNISMFKGMDMDERIFKMFLEIFGVVLGKPEEFAESDEVVGRHPRTKFRSLQEVGCVVYQNE